MSENDVVITGISGRFPKSANIEQLWNHLLAGDDLASPETLWEADVRNVPLRRGQLKSIEDFDYKFFNHPAEIADILDPQMRIFHETTYEAICDAGLSPDELRGSKTGVFIGACYVDTSQAVLSKGHEMDMIFQFTASEVSSTFDFHGPCLVIDTACASSLSCTNEAFLTLKNSSDVDAIVIGGLAIHLNPYTAGAFRYLRMISIDGKSKCLDKDVNGYCRSESIISVLLQKRKFAKRIYATIVHSRTNTDGYKPEGITFPKLETQGKLMAETLKLVNIDPLSIDYIEAHMTGTAVGDVVESKSITDNYRPSPSTKPLLFGCVKSNIGHTEGASGCLALTKASLVFQKRLIPPNINYENPNPNIEALMKGIIVPVLKPTEFNGDIIPVNCFGFGGVNAHLILKANENVENEQSRDIATSTFPRLVNLAARNLHSVNYMVDWFKSNTNSLTRDFLSLINDVSRIKPESGMHGRGVLLLNQDKQIIFEKTDYLEKRRKVWLFFSIFDNLNSVKFNSDLLEIPIIKETVDALSDCLSPFDLKLTDLLLNSTEKPNVTEQLVATVAKQVVLVDLFKYLEIRFDGVIGHSLGVIAAAYAENFINAKEALLTAHCIGKCLQADNESNGLMAIVNLDENSLKTYLTSNVSIVDKFCESRVVLSGPQSEMKSLFKKLVENEVKFSEVNFGHKLLHTTKLSPTSRSIEAKLSELFGENNGKINGKINKSLSEFFSSVIATKLNTFETLMDVEEDSVIVNLFSMNDDEKFSNQINLNKDLNMNNLLTMIGQIYLNGNECKIEKLYPKVEYPVARETASLSSLYQWDHSQRCFVFKYPDYFCTSLKHYGIIEVGPALPFAQKIDGHFIDGKYLFPATSYLYLAYEAFARFPSDLSKFSIEFHDVKFVRATFMPKTGSIMLRMNVNPVTGVFEIVEGDSVVATGRGSIIPEDKLFDDQDDIEDEDSEQEKTFTLAKKEIYRELRVRGYDYGQNFQGLELLKSDGSWGKINWKDNWISFTDALLQATLFEREDRILYLPTSIEYLKFNAKAFHDLIEKSKDDGKNMVYFSRKNGKYIVENNAMILKNVIGIQTSRRNNQKPVIRYSKFVPYSQIEDTNSPNYHDVNNNKITCDLNNNEMNFKNHLSKSKSNLDRELNDYENECVGVLDSIKNRNDVNVKLTKKFDLNSTNYSLLNFLNCLHSEGTKLDQQLANTLFNEQRINLDKDILVNKLCLQSLENLIDVIFENILHRNVQIVEVNSTMNILFENVEHRAKTVSLSYTTFLYSPYVKNLKSNTYQEILDWNLVEKNFPYESNCDIIVYKDISSSTYLSSDNEKYLVNIADYLKKFYKALKNGGFLLMNFRENLSFVEQSVYSFMSNETSKKSNGGRKFLRLNEIKQIVEKETNFVVVAERRDSYSNVFLVLRKTTIETAKSPLIIDIDLLNYNWVDVLNQTLNEKKNEKIWLRANSSELSGIVGFMNCLKKEAKGENVRSIFGENAQLTEEVMKRDLIMNVYKNNEWGSYRYHENDLTSNRKLTNRAYLDIQTSGDLSTLTWFEHSNYGNNLCTIYYSALNFKDVMVASGKVPLNAYPKRDFSQKILGIEYSGIDESGNRVCGSSNSGTFSTILTHSYFQWKVPDSWTLEEAATIPVAYLTVYYSLLIRGQLQRGESILIHAGSGAVGQAAISVCLSLGCHVFTTVGTKEKREFLLKKYPLLKELNIGHSRSASFEEFILKATDGKGVDVILNSLAEEKLRASLRCLADFGRFIEIGKYDITIDSPFESYELDGDKSFHAICLAFLSHDAEKENSPQRRVAEKLKRLVENGLLNGEITPLQRHVFERDQVEQAFRFMASGKHIGKVLIKMQDAEVIPPTNVFLNAIPQTHFSPDKCYIISGGLGGFGLEIAYWMMTRGAKKLLITSRSGMKTSYHNFAVERMRSNGVTVEILKEDGISYASAEQIFTHAKNLGPIGGVFNLNLVLRDAPIDEQTPTSFKEVCEAKVNTTLNFDKLTRQKCTNEFDFFVCFSSITSAVGNIAQTNYGFANSVMERICEKRREDGLHGVAVQWGAVGDAGYFADNVANTEAVIAGTLAQRIPSCLTVLDCFLQGQHSVCTSYIKADSQVAKGSQDILKQICHVLGVKSPELLEETTTLNDLGMDSLMAVEIKQGLERYYDSVLSTQEIRNLSIGELKDIEKKKFTSSSEKKSKNQSFTEDNLLLEKEIFKPLNAINEGVPIFILPPLESNFKTLSPMIQNFSRPAVGVCWTEEIDNLDSIKEIASVYVKCLQEKYPQREYSLIGYSVGGNIALEMALQLQETLGETSVTTLILLDASPAALAMQVEHIYANLNDLSKRIDEQLLSFALTSLSLENLEVIKIKEELAKYTTKDKKLERFSELLSYKLNQKIDKNLLQNAIDRMYKKMILANEYKQERKFVGKLVLIRATDLSKMPAFQQFPDDYGLSKCVNGKVEIFRQPGDHASFITKHYIEISEIVEEQMPMLV